MLVYSVDRAFLPLACISVSSMVSECSGSCPPVMFLLHDVDEQSRTSAARHLTHLGVDFELVEIDPEWCEPWASKRGQSAAKFGYLRLEEFTSSSADRIVVIDADTRFTDEVDTLINFALGDYALGAVYDTAVIADGRVQQLCDKLGVRSESGYFNSGLLLIDREKWVQACLSEAAISVFTERPEILTFNDQCALNAATNGQFRPLPMRWNCLLGSTPANWPASLYHYAGYFKPWKWIPFRRLPDVQGLVDVSHIDFYRNALSELDWHDDTLWRPHWRQVAADAALLVKLKASGRLAKLPKRAESPLLASFSAAHPELVR